MRRVLGLAHLSIDLALVRQALAFDCDQLPSVGQPLPDVGQLLARRMAAVRSASASSR
jgi:hypothetical protein